MDRRQVWLSEVRESLSPRTLRLHEIALHQPKEALGEPEGWAVFGSWVGWGDCPAPIHIDACSSAPNRHYSLISQALAGDITATHARLDAPLLPRRPGPVVG